jgi:hypothetical protein
MAADSVEVEVPPVKADEAVDVGPAGQVAPPEPSTEEEEEEETLGGLSTPVTIAAGSTAPEPPQVKSEEPVDIDEKPAADAQAPAASLGAPSQRLQAAEEAEPTPQSSNVAEPVSPLRAVRNGAQEEEEEEEPVLIRPTDAPPARDGADADSP